MKLFESNLLSEDLLEINKILKNGELGFGSNVPLFEKRFEHFSDKTFNISTNSASAAAFMIFAYFKEIYGVCDVYTTSLGFTSPAWAAQHFGHNLIFVDVQEDLQFSSKHYKSVRKKTDNKVVVMPVLYGGVGTINNFELYGDEIVVVDSAHCSTPTIEADYLFFSFHPYKPICTSDGGMISTNNFNANKFFRTYRNFGRVSRGLTYDVFGPGFKFYMNNLNATIGLTQLIKYHARVAHRKEIYNKLSAKYDLLPQDEASSYYFATTIVDNADELIKKYGISRHYPMLHKLPFYEKGEFLPKLEFLHSRILNLPLYREI